MAAALVAGLAIVASSGMATPAHASLVFTLTEPGCTGGCGTGPYGTITLEQGANNSTVIVTETLAPGVAFVNTGAGEALAFNIAGDPAVTIGGLSTGFDVGDAPTKASTFGKFDYSIHCSGCGNGASSPLPGPITFTVTDGSTLTPDSFVANKDGYFFSADILGTSGNTGNVAAKGPGTPSTPVIPVTPVPEPISIALLGTGLLGLSLVRRHKHA